MRIVRLSDNDLETPVAAELKTLLDSIIADSSIEHHEVDELKRWVDSRIEYSDEIPAISHLNWVLQVILADKSVEAFEWAILRDAIDKILPAKQLAPNLSNQPPLLSESHVGTYSAVTQNKIGDGDEWVIIDTETSGLFAPIYAVEIAAQRMRGWQPHGKPFRILLNHDVELEPAAVATHGYTRAYLRKHGVEPQKAHAELSCYANGLHMVSHNLAYDFNRVLDPEWKRLRIKTICQAGFCTVMLSRRCLPEISSAALDSLAAQFRLGEPTHHACEDVNITVKLVTDILAPRLEQAGIKTFAEAKAFSRKTPLTECRRQLKGELTKPQPRIKRPSAKARKFLAFLGQITADRTITNTEFIALHNWLETEGCHSSESVRVSDLVEKILADGRVSESELNGLSQELEKITAT